MSSIIPNLQKVFFGDREIDKILGLDQVLYSSGPGPIFDYFVDFETSSSGNKGSYASATVNLNGLDWDMTEALIGSLASDYREDERSCRLRGRSDSSITMLEDKVDGIGEISFLYRRFGTDAQIEWIVEYSLNSGEDWIEAGKFTADATIRTFSAVIDEVSDNVRMRIRTDVISAVDRRANVDNILITGYREEEE